MQKIFAILIVFSACTAFGARSAARLRQRATFLAALETALRRFLLAMEYEKKPLERLASKRVYGEAQPLFDAFAEALSAGARPEAAMRQAVQGTKDGARAWLPLGDAEAALLLEFAAIVGTPSAGRYAEGAEPVLLTPIDAADGDYAAAVRDLADTRGVRLLDMAAILPAGKGDGSDQAVWQAVWLLAALSVRTGDDAEE